MKKPDTSDMAKYQRWYYRQHREKEMADSERYRKSHLKEYAAYQRGYRKRNRKKMREYMRKYMRSYYKKPENYKKHCERVQKRYRAIVLMRRVLDLID